MSPCFRFIPPSRFPLFTGTLISRVFVVGVIRFCMFQRGRLSCRATPMKCLRSNTRVRFYAFGTICVCTRPLCLRIFARLPQIRGDAVQICNLSSYFHVHTCEPPAVSPQSRKKSRPGNHIINSKAFSTRIAAHPSFFHTHGGHINRCTANFVQPPNVNPNTKNHEHQHPRKYLKSFSAKAANQIITSQQYFIGRHEASFFRPSAVECGIRLLTSTGD